MRKALFAVTALAAGLIAGSVPAQAAPTDNATWMGQYSLERFAASKTGTSLAARQTEPDFSDTYTFASTCLTGPCVATVVGGPPADNPTLAGRLVQYTWDGTSWVHEYDWEWDCFMGNGVPKVFAPAKSVAYYTPQDDGTFRGVWTTEIFGESLETSPCKGTVVMDVAAYPVAPVPMPSFGS